MLIKNVTVESLGWGNMRLSWSGIIGQTVRVFLNGLLSFGPKAITSADKSIVVSMPDPVVVEVHESDASETLVPVVHPLMRKPLVWWSSRAAATEYRIYSGNQLLGVLRHNPALLHHEYQFARDLRHDGGVWTGLRVESVTASGRESVRPEFPVFAPSVPKKPSTCNISGSAGVFSFELEVGS
jgi:hypothetical protein